MANEIDGNLYDYELNEEVVFGFNDCNETGIGIVTDRIFDKYQPEYATYEITTKDNKVYYRKSFYMDKVNSLD